MGFWLCLAWVFYIYVGYPLVAFALAHLRARPVRRGPIEPRVTVAIAAFNEARDIEATLHNKLEQNYPADRLDVVVVSDGSTDDTDRIVTSVAARAGGRVRLVRQEREGKTQAMNRAFQHATGSIVVIADANSMYGPQTVRALVRNFADPDVGYVTGRMVYTNPTGTGVGEGSGRYMSYENLLREQESRLGSIVGVDGGVDAIRRELYAPMRAEQLPDFALPLSVVEQGYRVVYDPGAVVFEPALGRARDEFRMRVRVSLRAMWTLWEKKDLLNPFRHGLFAWQLLSHKVVRYAAFVPLLLLLVTNVLLVNQGLFYQAFLALQVFVYGLATLGHFMREAPSRASRLLLPYYFVLLNLACMVAGWQMLRGRRITLWAPRTGA